MAQSGIELGSRRFLHPGPLRWLRALGWMLLLFVLLAALNYGASQLAHQAFSFKGGWPALGLVTGLCLLALGVYAVAVRLAEDRWPEELNLGKAPVELVIGLATGAGMFALVMALLFAIGAYDIAGPREAAVLGTTTMAVESGIFEELLLRAVVFRLVMRAFGPWWALAFSAALFGALHLANPNATPTAAIAIAVEAGLMLAAFYVFTGRLWVSIGVHAAWNFTQAYIFGAAVSGFATKDSLWASTPRAGVPEILSGGAFGPEASLPAMLVGTAVAVGVLWWARRLGNFKARTDAAPVDAVFS